MSRFFSSLKGEKHDRDDLADRNADYAWNNPYRHVPTQPPSYQPPTGPIPGSSVTQQDQQKDENPPPYHDWMSIPDTSQLPPPPPITDDHSSASNAEYDEAAAARAWCVQHSVYTPSVPNVSLIEGTQAGQHDLDVPYPFYGFVSKLNESTSPRTYASNSYGANPASAWRIKTSGTTTTPQPRGGLPKLFSKSTSTHSIDRAPGDQMLTTLLPLYFASTSNPLSPHFAVAKSQPYTIYFEITPIAFNSPEATVAIGYTAKPYPPGRQPGWHRASLAVHSDDGNRYVNNSWGGQPFTRPVREGETVGLAVRFESMLSAAGSNKEKGGKLLQSDREVHSMLPKCKTRVYFTRNGAVEGSWAMDEERDAEKDEGIAGLQGECDLYAAVGIFGSAEVEVRFFAHGDGFVAPPA